MLCGSCGEFEKTGRYKTYILHVTKIVYNLDKVLFHFCSYGKICLCKMIDCTVYTCKIILKPSIVSVSFTVKKKTLLIIWDNEMMVC